MTFMFQMEKCREVTQGYSTKQECDKWPQQVCTLDKTFPVRWWVGVRKSGNKAYLSQLELTIG